MTGQNLTSNKRMGKTLSRRARILGGALVVALGAGALAVPALAERGPGGDGPRWGHHGPHGPRGDMMGRGLPDFAALDADGDGQVTGAELAAWRENQIAVDTDGDGRISAEELVAHELAKAELRIRADVERRMEAQDVNGDGLLDAEELLARPMPRLDGIFERIDTDGDGVVTAEEFQAAKDRMAEMRRDRQEGRQEGRRGGEDRPGRMPPPPAEAAPEAAPATPPAAPGGN